MWTRSLVVAAACSGFALAAPADPPDWTGKVKWAEKTLKTYPAADGMKGGVEALGKYEVPAGWEATAVQFGYMPKEGGTLKTVDTLKLTDGQFGAVDPKTKKVTAARVPLEPGSWTVRVMVTYKPKGDADAAGVPVQTPWVNVEVK